MTLVGIRSRYARNRPLASKRARNSECARAVLQAQINKTDRNDARGIAQMIRVGRYRPVHVKTLRSQQLRMLTHRKLLQSKAIDNDLRGTLRNFGLNERMVGKVRFEARIKELGENLEANRQW
jgi:transposase